MNNYNLKNIYFICLIVLLFCFGPRYVDANFEITEIMYDLDGTDTDREWVEVRNTSDTSVDLSKWYLFSDNTKHALNPVSEANVPSGSYAVIVQNPSKFKLDQPSFVGLIFDSSWTGLSNDGDTLALKDQSLNLVGEISFSSSLGANGDGKTLQKNAGVFVASNPTPGSGYSNNNSDNTNTENANNGSSNNSSSNNNTSGGGGSSTSSVIVKKESSTPIVTTDIIIPSTTIVAGLPYKFNQKTIGYSKERITYGYFIWNFGDGYTIETNNTDELTYTYPYEGDYILTLSYKNNEYNPIPIASDRVVLKVISNTLAISSVGSNDDPYIEIENKGKYEIDMSDFVLQGKINTFTIPKGTIIMPNHKIKFSPMITSFTYEDLSSVTLSNTIHKLLSVYPTYVEKAKKQVSYIARLYTPPVVSKDKDVKNDIVDLNALSANVNSSGVSDFDLSKYAWLGLILVICVGVSLVFILSKKNIGKKDEIEKDINPNDFSILE